MASVAAKDARAAITHTLREEFAQSRAEAEVVATRSLHWLRAQPGVAVPGTMRVSVPATPSRKYAGTRRTGATVTAVDIGEDAAVRQEFGIAALQRHRLVRWIFEIYRQGGFASLLELAAWANLTPTALGARLAPLRGQGLWLPHLGAPTAGDRLAPEPWLVARYLKTGQARAERALLGVRPSAWEAILARFAALTVDPASDVAVFGLSPVEQEQLLNVAMAERRNPRLTALRQAGAVATHGDDLEMQLRVEHGFSPVAARLYFQWLEDFSQTLRVSNLADGQVLFFAISADEGARAKLREANHLPVRLSLIAADDLALGPRSASPTKVRDLKFSRILRYTTEARVQGALLTLPDLALLLGMHVSAIQHKIKAHPEIIVPTRGSIKDIGRGVTHKARIVELYLQMYTETEIADRTGHSYEAIENYLRDFARIVALRDQGLNKVMIRRVIGRSLALVEAYLALYERYDQPDYHFRLAQIRHTFAQDEALGEKRGPRSPSRTRGRMR